MVDLNAALRQHFLKVAIADRIATIPAHRPQDHITLEMAPLEIRHRSVRPISAKHAQASRFLQQSRRSFRGGCGPRTDRLSDALRIPAVAERVDLRTERTGASGCLVEHGL